MSKNGIEICEDHCKCGKNLRLHTYMFRTKNGNQTPKFYVDCCECKLTSDWKLSPLDAINEFDSLLTE